MTKENNDDTRLIGIDPIEGHSVLAVYQEEVPKVIETGNTLEELLAKAEVIFAEDWMDSMVVIAVPAWYHDGHRQEIKGRGLAAGLESMRLINRPAATALAYSILQPDERSTLLIIELNAGRLDVTTLALAQGGYDILSCDGVADLGLDRVSGPAATFEVLEITVRKVLKDAALAPENLDDILLSGKADSLRGMDKQISQVFGCACSTHDRPDQMVALGAAVQAKLIAMGL